MIFEKFNLEGSVSEYNHAERTGDGNNHNITFFNDIYELKTSLNHKSLFNQNVEGLNRFSFSKQESRCNGR